MTTLAWILVSTFAMSLFAWVGLLTFALKEKYLRAILLPLVAFSAGALLGGAFLHLLPESIHEGHSSLSTYLWVLAGFTVFFALEQFISWHHCHKMPSEHIKPVTYLVLLADGIHNFIGGLAIAGSFLVSVNAGLITWIAAAAHEIPQEFGDFGILVHGGWKKSTALIYNFMSALTVVLGGIVAYMIAGSFDTAFLLPFAAGNFIYIAASDLIPEIKQTESVRVGISHFVAFIAGLGLLLAVKIVFSAHGH